MFSSISSSDSSKGSFVIITCHASIKCQLVANEPKGSEKYTYVRACSCCPPERWEGSWEGAEAPRGSWEGYTAAGCAAVRKVERKEGAGRETGWGLGDHRKERRCIVTEAAENHRAASVGGCEQVRRRTTRRMRRTGSACDRSRGRSNGGRPLESGDRHGLEGEVGGTGWAGGWAEDDRVRASIDSRLGDAGLRE